MKTVKPGKQRKRQFNAPKHKLKKRLTAKLNKDLAKQIKKKRLSIRVGDTVNIMRGTFRKRESKISKVFTEKGKVYLEGLNTKKANGTEIPVLFEVSNLMITGVAKKDKKRFKGLKIVDKTDKKENKETKGDK